MVNGVEAISWAPRVPPGAIRRLYRAYAQGIVDEELLEEVAYGLYARCQSILTVKAAKEGKVTCPCCGHVIVRERGGKDEPIRCRECGWQATWFGYRKTFLRRQLHHGGAAEVFGAYVERFPALRSPDEKMLLVDSLIHECHKMADAAGDRFPVRPVGPNLIRATMTEVIALLDELAFGPASGPEAREAHLAWRRKLDEGRARMKELVRGRCRPTRLTRGM